MKFSPARFYEHYKRSIIKTVTYRALIVIASYIVVYFITGEHSVTTAVVIISNTINTFLYFLHERLWNHIHWGKSKKKQ